MGLVSLSGLLSRVDIRILHGQGRDFGWGSNGTKEFVGYTNAEKQVDKRLLPTAKASPSLLVFSQCHSRPVLRMSSLIRILCSASRSKPLRSLRSCHHLVSHNVLSSARTCHALSASETHFPQMEEG